MDFHSLEEVRAEAEAHDKRSLVASFLDRIDSDSLLGVTRVLNYIATSDDPHSTMNFTLGHVYGLLWGKFHLCSCGRNHDADLLDHTKESMEAGVPAKDDLYQDLRVDTNDGFVILDFDVRSGNVRCKKCKTVFNDPQERMACGLDCPGCEDA